MFRRLTMAIFMLYMKYLLSSNTTNNYSKYINVKLLLTDVTYHCILYIFHTLV